MKLDLTESLIRGSTVNQSKKAYGEGMEIKKLSFLLNTCMLPPFIIFK